jgi:hypothetical protein
MIHYLGSLEDAGFLFRSLPNIVSYRIFHLSELRPFFRGIDDYGDMIRWWTELGFIVKKGD